MHAIFKVMVVMRALGRWKTDPHWILPVCACVFDYFSRLKQWHAYLKTQES